MKNKINRNIIDTNIDFLEIANNTVVNNKNINNKNKKLSIISTKNNCSQIYVYQNKIYSNINVNLY